MTCGREYPKARSYQRKIRPDTTDWIKPLGLSGKTLLKAIGTAVILICFNQHNEFPITLLGHSSWSVSGKAMMLVSKHKR